MVVFVIVTALGCLLKDYILELTVLAQLAFVEPQLPLGAVRLHDACVVGVPGS